MQLMLATKPVNRRILMMYVSFIQDNTRNGRLIALPEFDQFYISMIEEEAASLGIPIEEAFNALHRDFYPMISQSLVDQRLFHVARFPDKANGRRTKRDVFYIPKGEVW